MARTYWAARGQDWEFLGAFKDGHAAKPGTPQAEGRIIDIQDMGDVQAVHDRLQVETRPAPPRLVGLPGAITKRLQARVPAVLQWAQLEGYVK